MNAKQYQELASRTLIDRPEQPISDRDIMVIWNVMGLAGEAGEIAELITERPGEGGLSDEIGDAVWYIAAIATKLDLDLEKIMDGDSDYDFPYTSGVEMALSLCILVSDVIELCKKGIFHRHGLVVERVFQKLVDCMASISILASTNGLRLDYIMELNIDKLKERYPNGFSSEDSAKRVDTIKHPQPLWMENF